MLNPALPTQSLGRLLGEAEAAFAVALEAVFAGGTHEPAAVAAALQSKAVKRPSGTHEPWDEPALQSELAAVNAALDAAYIQNGIGA